MEDYDYDDPMTFNELLADYKKRMQFMDQKFIFLDMKFHELLKLISSGEYKTMTHDEIVDRIALNVAIREVDAMPLDDVFEIEKQYNQYMLDENGNLKY